MRKTLIAAVFAVMFCFKVLGVSHAAIVFTENFSDATTSGSPYTTQNYSERWDPTYYYNGSDPQWTFSGTALLATNILGAGVGADNAILLNEGPVHGSILSVNIPALVAGGQYLLVFEHWGDNRPSGTNPYRFDVSINGSVLQTVSRDYDYSTSPLAVPGTFVTASVLFTAPSSNITLQFTDTTTTGQASGIIDNIRISAVPIPTALWLLGSGLIGLVAIRRRGEK